MAFIVLDFETYFSTKGDKYTLRTSTTEEYIRDPRFEVLGFSYMVDDKPPVWVTGTHAEIHAALTALELERHVVCAHNARFDLTILAWVYNIRPKFIVDTLSMATVLGLRNIAGGALAALAVYFGIGTKGKALALADDLRRTEIPAATLTALAEYCCQDVRLTREIYLKMRGALPVTEFYVIDFTVRMFSESPFVLDIPLLEARAAVVERAKQNVLADVAESLGCSAAEAGTLLRSNDGFAELLLKHGVQPGMKPSPTNPEVAIYAFAKTDKFMADLLENGTPEVAALVSARLGERSTVEGTRLERFIGIGSRGTLPIPLAVAGAHTLRYSGGEKINLQNLPKRGGRDLTLRRAILAPPGHDIVAADSSQIEVRVLAYVANHTSLLEAFRVGGDPYIDQAAKTYNRPAEDIRAEHSAGMEPGKTQRSVAKEAVLSAGYQCGYIKFHDRLRIAGVDIALVEAKRAIDAYRRGNPDIVRLWDMCRRMLGVMTGRSTAKFGGPNNDIFTIDARACQGRTDVSPYIMLPDENRIWYHGLTARQGLRGEEYQYYSGREAVYLYGGKLTENIIQALAFAILKWQALQLRAAGVPIHLNVHDEWVSVVPTERVPEVVALYKKWMSTAPPWMPGLPLACEVGVAKNYGDV